ncbi:hypothetical protein L1049_020478 [Liquidambar formosana]|uniref:Uncharacterized protein n=1 Tax=Liquidambar formosana TaxID=63359 RepID=A0AAP0SD56_LIQFO
MQKPRRWPKRKRLPTITAPAASTPAPSTTVAPTPGLATTVPAASTPAPSTTIAPTPGLAPEAQLQHQTREKCPRISVSAEAAPCDSIDATSTIHSIQQPLQQPAGLFTNHNGSYLSTSITQYLLPSLPPVNQHMRPYPPNPTQFYPRLALRPPGNFVRPVPFNGPWDIAKAPGYHLRLAPLGDYALPPPQYCSPSDRS